MLMEGNVRGDLDMYPSGSPVVPSLDRQGGIKCSDTHGRYMDAVLRGNCYIGCNTLGTPVTTQAGLSATTPALTLYNPVGSGVLLALLRVAVDVNAAPGAATTVCLAYNAKNATAPSSVTNGTMVNARMGNANSPLGQAYAIATLATAPVAFRYLGSIIAASSTNQVHLVDEVAGQIIVEEGVAISVQAKTAVAVYCEMLWEEIKK